MKPKRKPQRNPIPTVTFRPDTETVEALEALEAAVGPAVPGARSVAIRRALLDAAARLDEKGGRK